MFTSLAKRRPNTAWSRLAFASADGSRQPLGVSYVTQKVKRFEVRFGLGLFRKAIPVPEIVTHRAVRNPWYYGWGIRLIPGGWLFNVSDFWAVELQMNKGKRYRIGTDDVAGLRAALEESLRSERP